MNAERAIRSVQPQEALANGEPKLGGMEATAKLREIWFTYALSGSTPEALDVRRKALTIFNGQLSDEAAEYLTEPLQSSYGSEIITRGQKAQIDGLKAGSDQLNKNRKTISVQSPRKPKGERVAIRRRKAYERRGTRPGLIH